MAVPFYQLSILCLGGWFWKSKIMERILILVHARLTLSLGDLFSNPTQLTVSLTLACIRQRV